MDKLHNQKPGQGARDGQHSLLGDMSVSEAAQMVSGLNDGMAETQTAAMPFPSEGLGLGSLSWRSQAVCG